MVCLLCLVASLVCIDVCELDTNRCIYVYMLTDVVLFVSLCLLSACVLFARLMFCAVCACVGLFACLAGWLIGRMSVCFSVSSFVFLQGSVCAYAFRCSTRACMCVCACVRVCLYRQNYHYVFASWCDRCLCVWMHVLSMHIICVTRQYSYTVLHLKIRVYSIIQLCSLCAHATHMGQHAHAHTSKAFHIHTKLRVRGLG